MCVYGGQGVGAADNGDRWLLSTGSRGSESNEGDLKKEGFITITL